MRALLLALVLALPLAAAGTPDDPEVTDPAGDARLTHGCSDITSAWVETDDAGRLLFHMSVVGCDAIPTTTNEFWGIRFLIGEQEYFMHGYWDLQDRACHFWHGRMVDGQTQDHVPGDCTYAAGTPATISFPYSEEIVVLAPGETLFFGPIHTGLINGRNKDYEFDTAEATRPFTRAGPAPSETAAPPTDVPAAVPLPWAFAVGALALALGLRRRRA